MRIALVPLAFFALVALPAAADRLITADGSVIETRGAWEVRGQTVLFRLADGSLSSLHLEEVDIEASHEATRAAKEPARAAAKPATATVKKPALVLTDRDVRHVDPSEVRVAEAADETTIEDEESAAPRLTVSDWQEDNDPSLEGLALVGTVRNSSSATVMGAGLIVRIFDAEDNLLATADAQLTARNLPPGSAANFRASFPSIYSYSRADFETAGLALETRGADDVEAPGVPALRDRETAFGDEEG